MLREGCQDSERAKRAGKASCGKSVVQDVFVESPSCSQRSLFHLLLLLFIFGLKKTRPFRFLLLKRCSFGLVHGEFFPFWVVVHVQKLAVNARNCAKTTKIKSGVLETPVVLMLDNCSFVFFLAMFNSLCLDCVLEPLIPIIIFCFLPLSNNGYQPRSARETTLKKWSHFPTLGRS